MPMTLQTKLVSTDRGQRQEVIERLYPGAELELRREPGNIYDENAIRVYEFDYSDDDIGYLNQDLAATIAPILDRYKNEES